MDIMIQGIEFEPQPVQIHFVEIDNEFICRVTLPNPLSLITGESMITKEE